MKVAHVTSTFPPYWAGTGNVAYHNARILHERGHEVTLFTAETPDAATYPTPFETRRLRAPLRLGNAPLTPALVRELAGYDLVHLHYPYIFGAELAVAAARLRRTPLVLTYHNQLQESHRIKRALFGAYNLASEPLVLRAARRVFAVSLEHLASLHPRLASGPRARELPNGVDTTVFRPDPAGPCARSAIGTPGGRSGRPLRRRSRPGAPIQERRRAPARFRPNLATRCGAVDRRRRRPQTRSRRARRRAGDRNTSPLSRQAPPGVASPLLRCRRRPGPPLGGGGVVRRRPDRIDGLRHADHRLRAARRAHPRPRRLSTAGPPRPGTRAR